MSSEDRTAPPAGRAAPASATDVGVPCATNLATSPLSGAENNDPGVGTNAFDLCGMASARENDMRCSVVRLVLVGE